MEEKADINQIIADMPTALLSWYGFEKPGRILYISGGEDHLSRSLKAQGRDVSCLGMEGSVSETFLSGHLGSFAYIMPSNVWSRPMIQKGADSLAHAPVRGWDLAAGGE